MLIIKGNFMVDIESKAHQTVPPAEVDEVELYHATSFWTKYVFSQDAKIIAIQYLLRCSRRWKKEIYQ
mgnify:CR=1 FL=1